MDNATTLLPIVSRRADYIQLHRDVITWLPAIHVICQRHGLSSDTLVRLDDGTNVIFTDGENYIIKLFPPYWRREMQTERMVAEHVYDRLPIMTPHIVAHGELEGWPYLVMSRLKGIYLGDVWDNIEYENRLSIIGDLGKIVKNFHVLLTQEAAGGEASWRTLIQRRLKECEHQQRKEGVPEYFLQQIPAFLTKASPLFPQDFKPTMLCGDWHQHHLLVTEQRGRWKLCGLFDFDDAQIGFHEYDLASVGLFMTYGQSELLQTFLLEYGYASKDLNESLTRRLMAYSLLHRYRKLNWIQKELVRKPSIASLEELAQAIYGLN
jgi:hygromycin-B 7''-O-kinase